MKLQSILQNHTGMKFMPAIMMLCLSFGAANVHAENSYYSSNLVSLLTPESSREIINRELRTLEQEYINEVIHALNSEPEGPDFSSDEVYVNHLVDVVEGRTQLNQPNFADDSVYIDHLVEILL